MKPKKIIKENRPLSTVCNKTASLQVIDIFKIFTEVQWTDAYHEKYTKQLKRVYENTPFKIFVDDFIKCLKKVFISNDKSMEKNVELTFDFASNFIVSLSDPDSEETCPFLTKVFEFLFDNHDCYDTAVRLHCCQFINCILKSMGPNGSLDLNLCEKISVSMMERMQDKIASVRTQAVYALHRLQDPSDENCKVIAVFLYHMTRDPSPEVRCAVINNVLISHRTLTTILTRINDCKDEVRKDAYAVCSKVSVQTFRIKQRQMMLNSGFLDPSDKVKNFVKNELLRKWVNTFKNDYIEFLRILNVQSELGLEVGIKSLKAIFIREEKCELVDFLLSRMKQKTIPYNCLTPESVLFWRILTEYLQPPRDAEAVDELFEKVLPDLTLFSNYIKGFFTSYNFSGSSVNSDDDDARSSEKEFILMQLLEITKCYDLSDEYGRQNFSQLCIALLKDPQVTVKSVPIIISRLSWAMPDVTERIAAIVELISDLREPFFDMDVPANNSFSEIRNIENSKTQLMERLTVLENERLEASQTEDMMIAREIEKEIATIKKKLSDLQRQSTDLPLNQTQDENIDPVVATKVLKIINEMIDSRDVTKLTPTLRSLFDNVVLPSFKRNMRNATISSLSLETFGLFCLLDPDLARERFIVFCFLISNGSLTVPALKAVFDLLQKYGLKKFSLKDDDDVKDEEDHRKSGNSSRASSTGGDSSGKYVIPLLYSLLDSDSVEVRNVAASGLCKLLLIGHLRSHTLVAKLIALWFNPVAAEDPGFRQTLSLFFKAFVKTRGAQYILEKAFLPSLQLFFDASPDDPLSEVDIDNVAKLLVNLTHSEFGAALPKGYCVHTRLAEIICDELLQHLRNSKEKSTLLMKTLSLLSIQSSDLDVIKDLLVKAETLSHKYKSMGEKNCQRFAAKFSARLNILKTETETKLAESEICNTLSTTAISDRKSEVTTSMSASVLKNESSNIENVTKMEVDDSVKKNETAVKTDVCLNANSEEEELSDKEDSVFSSDCNYSKFNKNKNQVQGDIGIVIPSSDEEEEGETEATEGIDPIEKRSLRSNSSVSLTSQEEIEADSFIKKRRNVRSRRLSPSSVSSSSQPEAEKTSTPSSGKSLTSQEEVESQNVDNVVKKGNLRAKRLLSSSKKDTDKPHVVNIEEKQSLKSSSMSSQEEIGVHKVVDIKETRSLRSGSVSSQDDEIQNLVKLKEKKSLRSNSLSSQSSLFDSPQSTSSSETFTSPAVKATPRKTRYNTRSAHKVKK